MSPPARERRPGQGGAESRGGRRLNGDSTPPPPDHEYDEQAIDLEGHEPDHLAADWWTATCLAVERGVLDPDEVEFPPGARPLAAIRSSRGGWRLLG